MFIKDREAAEVVCGMFRMMVNLGFIEEVWVEEESSLEDWGIHYSGQSWIVTIVSNDGKGTINVRSKSFNG